METSVKVMNILCSNLPNEDIVLKKTSCDFAFKDHKKFEKIFSCQ